VEAVVDDLVNNVNILSNNNAMSTDTDSDASFKQAQASIQSLCQQFSHFQEDVTARIDHLNSIYVKLGESTTMSSSKVPNTYSADRSLIILLLVLKKTRMLMCGSKVFDVLKFVVGKDVDTVDMFRLGRFVTEFVLLLSN
jgi:hypothetical protein